MARTTTGLKPMAQSLALAPLKESTGESFGTFCPYCNKVIEIDEDLHVLKSCLHFVRRWRVTADQRIRVEFDSRGVTEALT